MCLKICVLKPDPDIGRSGFKLWIENLATGFLSALDKI
jgi:hypothetical protein